MSPPHRSTLARPDHEPGSGAGRSGPRGTRLAQAHRTSLAGLRVIPRERLPAHLRLLLAAEILGVYASTRRRLLRANAIDLARELQGRRPACQVEQDLGPAQALIVARRLAGASTRSLRLLPSDPKCLIRSLVLLSLLASRGIPARLVIGAHTRREFEAHAWVEYDGRKLLPAHDFGDARLLEL
jgi:Transglutaminase-like superfamily